MEVSPRSLITGPSILENGITGPSILENGAGDLSAFKKNGSNFGRSRKVCTPICINRIATWNVEGLSGPSQIKYVELCMYMRQHGIAVLCLQETHIFGAEKLEYEGFSIYLSGESFRDGRSFSGVGFIVAPWAIQAVVSFQGINDRLARIRMKVFGGVLNVLSVYIPHDGHDLEYRQHIFDDLSKYTRRDHDHESTVVFGDFNAQLGYVGTDEESIIGQHVFKKTLCQKPGISNRDLLLEHCTTHEVLVKNTFFDYPDELLVSYFNLSAKPMDTISTQAFSQIDHVLCGQNNSDMVVDCWTNRTDTLRSHHFITTAQVCVSFTPKQQIRKSKSNRNHT